MRLDFDVRRGGTASVRKAFSIVLPPSFELSFRLRGEAPPGAVVLDLIDAAGERVWTSRKPAFRFPGTWTEVVGKKRRVAPAAGSNGGGEILPVAAIELSIVANEPGRGTVWLDELQLRPREPDRTPAPAPRITASSEVPGAEAGRALDGDPGTAWRPAVPDSGAPDAPSSLVIDFQRARELGGLVIDWEAGRHATRYDVDVSADGTGWQTRHRVAGGDGGRDYIALPESETRFVRLRLERGPAETFGIREVAVQPLEWSATSDAFFAAVAADAPPGSYPRRLSGGQSHWTVAGANGDEAEVFVDADGAVEAANGRFSIEPFVFVDGRLFTWRDVRVSQSLGDGRLPQPSVTWDGGDWTLTLAPVVTMGGRDSSAAYLQYLLWNRAPARRSLRLYLALRPFQVSASRQHPARNDAASIRDVAIDGDVIRVDGDPALVSLSQRDGFGAAAFDQGNIVDFLRAGTLPPSPSARDDAGQASAALSYVSEVDSGLAMTVEVALPLGAGAMPGILDYRAARMVAHVTPLRAAAAGWRTAFDRVAIELPPSASRVANSLYANLGYMLVHRDGAALEHGSRGNEGSWVRHAAMQGRALLRLGHPEPVREYLEWYAQFQLPSGAIPCCIDAPGGSRAADAASHGAFIHLAVEYWRHTQDRAMADRMWPYVARAAGYIDSLRHRPAGARYDADFFSLRGLKDAVELAHALSRPEEAQLTVLRDELRRDLYASIQLAMIQQRTELVPATRDVGGFDPAATALAISPGGELGLMPETIARALDRTFERYWDEFVGRQRGTRPWMAYASSEIGIIGAMVHLGRRDRAHELLAWFLDGQRPAAWHQWAEVVWRDSTSPAITGDMPDSRTGAAYVASVLDMFAYEREADSSLVVAAGVPESWIDERPGVTVRRLATHYGPLSYTIRREPGSARVSMQAGTRIPPGGIVVHSPFSRPPREALVNGIATPSSPSGGVVVRALPAEVVFRQ